MKPLGLREIADELGLHESTVSRVTNNKYMATPLGVFELKYFFSRALATSSGGTCSATAIRGAIKDMIHEENPKEPLSDAHIARLLGRQGLQVARRTVTKYRQMMRVPAYRDASPPGRRLGASWCFRSQASRNCRRCRRASFQPCRRLKSLRMLIQMKASQLTSRTSPLLTLPPESEPESQSTTLLRKSRRSMIRNPIRPSPSHRAEGAIWD
jgi:AraC-like DNA-binding protein